MLHEPQARADYAHLERPTGPSTAANTHGGGGVPSASTPTNTTRPSAHASNPRIISYGAGVPPAGYMTHVFAPIVTGAPTKKTKFPNSQGRLLFYRLSLPNPLTLSLSDTCTGVSPSASLGALPAVPFAATNGAGQRICRRCGAVGRYKDGKCAEKWGPGPMGPGTVCDR